jgi:hypothetical protein
MAKFVNPGDSVEGDKILAYGRKIIPSGLPVYDKNINKFRYSISIKKGGGAQITKPLDPMVAYITPKSHLNLDDEIAGDMLEGSSNKKFDRDQLIVGGARTATHSRQSWTMAGSCFVKIVTNWLKQTQALRSSPKAHALEA